LTFPLILNKILRNQLPVQQVMKREFDMASETSLAASPTDQPREDNYSNQPRRADAERSSLALILNIVREADADTRPEIERLTGLGRAIVSDRLATLFSLGLAEEGDLGQTTGGRAPRTIQFNPNAGLVLVATLDQSRIGVGMANLKGQLIAEHHEATDNAAGPVQIQKRLITLFDWMLGQHRKEQQVWGIGISAPGPVEEFENASPRLRLLPGWDEYPIVDHLLHHFRAPVWMRSGVQMMAYGEYKSGSAAGTRDIIYVNLGRSIGAGLISEGQLHRGALGGAGLLGHVAVADGHQYRCSCGNIGCLDTEAGADAIARDGLALATSGESRLLAETLAAEGTITAADVSVAAQSGDSAAAEILARCGHLIGTALASLVNAFNPSLISLGGEVGQLDDILLAAIRESVYRSSHPLVTRDLRIQRSALGNSAGLAGAALVVTDSMFAPDSVVNWIASGAPHSTDTVLRQIARADKNVPGNVARPVPPAAA
jgi:predicted NBD/HSP70 family sugar kinase